MNKRTIQQKIQTHRPEIIGDQKQFAVFLPLIKVKNQYHVLYEVRADHISQAGETSFPGGTIESGETPKMAAIRETSEELNIPIDWIDVWQELDYLVSEWAIVHCFVGEIKNTTLDSLHPNKEVDYVFTIPLTDLLNQTPIIKTVSYQAQTNDEFPYHLINHGKKYPFRNIKHSITMYQLPNEKLWGMTATLTYQFIQLLKKAPNKVHSDDRQ